MPLIQALWVVLMLTAATQDPFGAAEYEATVEAYQRGETKGAAAALARWPAASLRRAVEAVTRAPTRWKDAHLRDATLLHRDVVFGGHLTSAADVVLHLDLASRLTLGLDVREPGTASFRADWHLLAAHVLLSRSMPDEAERFVRRGLERDTENARLALIAGIIEEHRAYRLDATVNEPATIASLEVTPARRHLVLASDHYRRALARDRTAAEAAMRLGHVLFLTNQWAEAKELLERAAAAPGGSRVRYLASLFLGTLHLRQNDAEAARRIFAAAVKLSPDSQTPYIALSLAEQSLGRAAAAHSVIASWARRPAPAVLDDPWWDYYYGVVEIGPLSNTRMP